MNGEDQALNFVYLIGVLVLVTSALMVRKIPIGQGLKMFAAWALIFLAVFMVFVLKDDFIALGQRVMKEARGEGNMVRQGRTLRIRKSDDGHFHVVAQVNGKPVSFMIDSGATVTSISAETARRVGIEPDGGFPVLVQTANGVVTDARAHVDRLQVGPIERRAFEIEISESLGPLDVLGMNFLSSLSSWGVEGEWLVLKP